MAESLDQVLSAYEGKENELIPVLQAVQEELGYLPEEVMREIAEFIGVPESRVYSVATFYTQFRFTPIGRRHIMVCRGTACHVRGAPRILADVEKALGIKEGETTPDMEYSLETVGCIGACGLAPNITVNEEIHGRLTPQSLAKVLDKIRSRKEGPSDEQ